MKSPFCQTLPTTLHDFGQDLADYVVYQLGTSTGTRTTSTLSKFGSQSIKVDHAATNSDYTRITVDLDAQIDLSSYDVFHLVVHHETGDRGLTKGAGIQPRVLVATGNNFSNYKMTTSYLANNSSRYKPGTYIYSMKKDAFTSSNGTLNWAQVDRLAFYMRNPYSDFTGSVTLDAFLGGGVASKVPVTFAFDDSDAEQNDIITKLESYGWKTTLFTATGSGYLDSAGNLTTAEVLAHNAAGHRSCNHTADHTSAHTASPQSDHFDDIDAAHLWHQNNATPWLPFYAYTVGDYDDATIAHLKSRGYVAARSADSPLESSWGHSNNTSCLFDVSVDESQVWENIPMNFSDTGPFSTAALMNAEIDNNVDHMSVVHLYGHYISTNPGTIPVGSSASRGYVTSEFDSVLSHLATLEAAGTIEVMPWHEWASRMLGYGVNGISAGGPIGRRRGRR